MMKAIKITILSLLLPFMAFCQTRRSKSYVFTKPYCEKVVVGGIVGIKETCYKIGDKVVGVKMPTNKVKIRIAKHTKANEGKPSNICYQEFIEVPMDYFIKAKK